MEKRIDVTFQKLPLHQPPRIPELITQREEDEEKFPFGNPELTPLIHLEQILE